MEEADKRVSLVIIVVVVHVVAIAPGRGRKYQLPNSSLVISIGITHTEVKLCV